MIVDVDIKPDLPELEETELEKLAHELGDVVLDEIRQNFRFGGRPDKWEPLAKGGPSFLFDTGNLLMSLEMTNGVAESDVWAEVSTDVDYAEYVNFGTSRMPQREFATLGDESIERIKELAGLRIVEILKSEKTKTTNKREEF